MIQRSISISKKYLISFILLTAICMIPALPGKLHAQFHCTGAGCALLPFSQSDLDRMLVELQNQYTDTLFDDMAEAAVLANLAGAPMGTVNLQRFTVGVSGSLGVVPPHDVTVNVPGLVDFEDVPSAGAAFTPRIFAGVNLGWIMGMGYDPYKRGRKKTPFFLSPARFDIYVSAIDIAHDVPGSENNSGGFKANIYHRGFEIHYHLVEGRNLVAGPGVRFLGVSLAAGMSRTRQDFSYTDDASDIHMTVEAGTQVIWEGENKIAWTTDIDVYPVEIRTGIQLMYFFNITLGMGYASTKGSTDFVMSRIGQAYIRNDIAASLGAELPDAFLSMQIIGDGRVPDKVTFMKLGLEINILAFKIALEGVATENAYAGNVAVRVAF